MLQNNKFFLQTDKVINRTIFQAEISLLRKLTILKNKSFYGKNVYGFQTKNKFSVDINYQKDLDYLNFLLKKN